MNERVYQKLVRDRIPEIIRAGGATPVCRTLSAEDARAALDQKLNEEVLEYQTGGEIEELADVLEVLHGIADARGIMWDEIERIRAEKKAARGGFSDRVFLERVIKP